MTLRAFLYSLLIPATGFFPLSVTASEPLHSQLEMFPVATANMIRRVIVLEEKERSEEDSYRVEIVAGKTLLTDGVNKLQLGSSLESLNLEGWGYTYYRLGGSGNVISTLMAAPDGAKKVEQWVSGKSLLIPYNSRLPIVVYLPQGYELRYRIWQAPSSWEVAKKG